MANQAIPCDAYPLGDESLVGFSADRPLAQDIYGTMAIEQLTSRMFEHGAEVALRQRACRAPVRGDLVAEALACGLAARCRLDAKPPIDAGEAVRLDAAGTATSSSSPNLRGLAFFPGDVRNRGAHSAA